MKDRGEVILIAELVGSRAEEERGQCVDLPLVRHVQKRNNSALGSWSQNVEAILTPRDTGKLPGATFLKRSINTIANDDVVIA